MSIRAPGALGKFSKLGLVRFGKGICVDHIYVGSKQRLDVLTRAIKQSTASRSLVFPEDMSLFLPLMILVEA